MGGGWRARLDSLGKGGIWKVLLVGLIIRESFSFWTGHPYDLEVWVRTGAAVAAGHNPYNQFWVPVPGVSFAFLFGPMPSAAYLPFWPIVTGALFRLYEAVGHNDPFVLYFLLKQPPILGDLLDGILLYRLALSWSGTPAVARRLLWVWMLFPYDIVISAIWGQFDALVATTLLAALAYRSDTSRQVLYGLGVFMKWVTAIFLPYELFRLKGTRRLLPFFALGLALALTLLSFFLLGWGFTGIQSTSVSQTHGGGGGMNLAGVLTSGLVIYQLAAAAPWLYEWAPYLWIPVSFIAGAWAAWRSHKSGNVGELEITMVIVTAFLLTRWGLYEQYMLYLFPLMLLDIYVFHPARKNLFLVLAVLCSVYLILNNVLGIWFLSPVWHQAFIIGLQLNASSGFGTFRAWALDALAILVTVTLIQFVYLLSHPNADPRPWVLWWRAPATPPAAGVVE
jgi:hypothetical protein